MATSDNSYEMFAGYLVEHYAPLVLFLAPNLDILYINGTLDDYFSLPKAVARFNVGKMVSREVLIIFQNGVSKALIQANPVLYEDVVFYKKGEARPVDLKFTAIMLSDSDRQCILVELIPRKKDNTPGDDGSEEENELIDHYARRLEHEIKETSRGTQQLISELEAANEELQASNGELLAANEELQSTNEELQSVNEELNTVNAELQFKNEELAVANNDINNLLKSTRIGTVFLDTQLRIRTFTPSISRQFKLIDQDIGRSITDFASTLGNVDIAEICRRVYRTLENFEEEVVDQEGSHYLLRVLPYRTQEDEIRGLVITFVDLAELEKTRELLRNMANKYRAISSHSSHSVLTILQDGRILNADTTWEGWDAGDLEGQMFFDLIRKEDRPAGRKAFSKMLEKKEAREFSCRIPGNGQNGDRLLHATFIPLEEMEGDAKKVLLFLEDQTDELAAQEMRLKDLQEYVSFVENSPRQMAIINEEGTIRFINFTRYTGVERQNMIGTSIYAYLPEDQHEKIKHLVHQIFSGQPSGKFIFYFEHQDGRRIQYELIGTPVILDSRIRYIALIGQSR